MANYIERNHYKEVCPICGEESEAWAYYDDKRMCLKCSIQEEKKEIVKRAEQVEETRGFESWSGSDMTTAFFEIFGRYLKNPNSDDWLIIDKIYHWAVHANHTLSESIRYTVDWAGLNMNEERGRWNEGRKLKKKIED